MKLIIVEGPNAGQELDHDGTAVLGRDPAGASVVLEDPEASRRHASISGEGADLAIEDLGSTNGTFVNGERIEGSRAIGAGDRIRIGTTVLEVRIEVDATAVSPVPEPVDPDATAVGQPAPAAEPPPPPPPPADEPPPPPPPPGVAAPPPLAAPGTAPAYPPVPYAAAEDYPIDFQADYPAEGIARWRPLVHGLLLIPHGFALFFLSLGALFTLLATWFAILFTGRYPEGLFNFHAGLMRWSNRVGAYGSFMNEKYPRFSLGEEPDYPARTRVDYPPDGKVARWRALVQVLMAFPHFVVLYFLAIAVGVVVFVAFFAVLFTRQWPEGLFKFAVGVTRWGARVTGFSEWTTEKYPPFQLEP